MADRVKKVAQEEAKAVSNITKDAALSGTYIYPIQGVLYFVSHKSLWKPLLKKLAPTLTLSTAVTAAMFLVAYVPQAAVMAFTEGPAAPFSAALLVLNQSSTLVNFLAKTLLVDEALIDTFDGVLLDRDLSQLVEEGREVKRGNDPIGKLGKLAKRPFTKFSPNALIRYMMYLPLNFIPVVGTVIFITLQGKNYGPQLHSRYFQLKKINKGKEQDEWVEQRRGAYTSFGVVASLLEMVPIANILFAFTNTVGAALWAADIETKGTTAPNLREQAKKAE